MASSFSDIAAVHSLSNDSPSTVTSKFVTTWIVRIAPKQADEIIDEVVRVVTGSPEQRFELDRDGVEWLGADGVGGRGCQHDEVALRMPAMDEERAGDRIDDPIVRNRCPVVGTLLGHVVAARRGRRNDLAHPVGAMSDWPTLRPLGYAFAAPPGDVGEEDVVHTELDLHLGGEPPSTGTASTAQKRWPQELLDRTLNVAVLERRGGLFDENAGDHLETIALGRSEVGGGRELLDGGDHRDPF